MKYIIDEKPVYNEATQTLIPRYSFEDEVFRTSWEIADKVIDEVNEIEEPIEEPTTEELIEQYKAELSATDYKAIKYAEGWLTDEEYAPIKTERESIRQQIRELERTQ